MKKCILFAALHVTALSFAAELHDFNEIKAAVTVGKTIHIVTDFQHCTAPDSRAIPPKVVGTFTPSATIILNDRITTSLTHFTLNNPRFLEKAVYEFVTYTLTETNDLKLTDQVLDAVNYLPLADKFSVTCKIGSGAKIYT